jgi:hypothetical protein
LVGGDVVVAAVEGFGDLDLDAEVGELGLDEAGDLDDLQVLEAEVERAPVDLLGRGLEELAVEVDHVGHADVRPALFAAVDGDDAFAQGVGGELVDREVEPLARGVAADGGRAGC